MDEPGGLLGGWACGAGGGCWGVAAGPHASLPPPRLQVLRADITKVKNKDNFVAEAREKAAEPPIPQQATVVAFKDSNVLLKLGQGRGKVVSVSLRGRCPCFFPMLAHGWGVRAGGSTGGASGQGCRRGVK